MQKKKKINWWVILALIVICVPLGYVGMGVVKQLLDKKPAPDHDPDSEELVLSVDKRTLSFSPESGSQDFGISSNTDWEISLRDDDDWVTLSTESGSDEESVSVEVNANETNEVREATLVIKWEDGDGESKKETVKISQEAAAVTPEPEPTPNPGPDPIIDPEPPIPPVPSGPLLSVRTRSLSLKSEGGSKTLRVNSNTDWQATLTGGDGWLTLGNTSGSGSAGIVVTATPNADSNAREATLSVRWIDADGASHSENVTVSQAPTVQLPPEVKTLRVNKNDLSFKYRGESKTVRVTSNTDWQATVTGGDAWLTLSSASGSRNASITVTAAPNIDPNTRTATININWTNAEGVAQREIIGITQEAAPPPLPDPITKEEAQAIVSSGRTDPRVPDNCWIDIVGSSSDANYARFRTDVQSGKYESVTVQSLKTESRTGFASSMKVQVTKRQDPVPAPDPVQNISALTKEQVQNLVAAGDNSQIEGKCQVVMNNSERMSYSNFSRGVRMGTFKNIRVMSIESDGSGKVTKIVLTASEAQDND